MAQCYCIRLGSDLTKVKASRRSDERRVRVYHVGQGQIRAGAYQPAPTVHVSAA